MSKLGEPLLHELKRLVALRPATRAEALAALDDCTVVKRRLLAARDVVGLELTAVRSGLAATNAYGKIGRTGR